MTRCTCRLQNEGAALACFSNIAASLPLWLERNFDGAFATTDHYARERLRSGHRLHGPAIIVQADATSVLQPGYVAEVDSWLNLVIKPEQPGGNRAGRA